MFLLSTASNTKPSLYVLLSPAPPSPSPLSSLSSPPCPLSPLPLVLPLPPPYPPSPLPLVLPLPSPLSSLSPSPLSSLSPLSHSPPSPFPLPLLHLPSPYSPSPSPPTHHAACGSLVVLAQSACLVIRSFTFLLSLPPRKSLARLN